MLYIKGNEYTHIGLHSYVCMFACKKLMYIICILYALCLLFVRIISYFANKHFCLLTLLHLCTSRFGLDILYRFENAYGIITNTF